jgi:perosamine synthetase
VYETHNEVRPMMVDAPLTECFCFYRGRTALYAILCALDLRQGDEVILQAYTCLAVVLPVLFSGATPIYADIERRSYTLDPAALESRITVRTRVLIIQHTFGIPAQLDTLLAIAKRHNLVVIEDCCHACGSTYKGKALGSFGTAAFYSYQWSKPLVVGRGGLALINNYELADRVRKLRTSFTDPSISDVAAINLQYLFYRMLRGSRCLNWLRGAIRSRSPLGVATGMLRSEELEYKITADYTKKMAVSVKRRLSFKFRNVHRNIEERLRVGSHMHNHLLDLGVSAIEVSEGASIAFMRHPVVAISRQQVLREGKAWNLDVSPSFGSPVDPLPREQWARVGYRAGSCPVAEYLAETTVTLPVNDWASRYEVDRVLDFADVMTAKGYLEAIKTSTGRRTVGHTGEDTERKRRAG